MNGTPRGPMVCADTWGRVVARAEGRCQCAGVCGKKHKEDGGRCRRLHDVRIKLVAAPEDLTLSDVDAASVLESGLRAWCPECFAGARRKQRAGTKGAVQSESLFDL